MGRVVRAGALMAAFILLASPSVAVVNPTADHAAKGGNRAEATMNSPNSQGEDGGSEAGSTSALYLNYRGMVPSVPEPATWAIMMLGFGLAGSAVRRRRRMIMPRVFA